MTHLTVPFDVEAVDVETSPSLGNHLPATSAPKRISATTVMEAPMGTATEAVPTVTYEGESRTPSQALTIIVSTTIADHIRQASSRIFKNLSSSS